MEHFLNFPFFIGQSYGNDGSLIDTSSILKINGKDLKCIQLSAKINQNKQNIVS